MPPNVEPEDQREAEAEPVRQRAPIVCGDGRGPEALAGALRLRFAEPGQSEGEHEDADRGEREIDRPPRRDIEDERAEARGDHRRDAVHLRDRRDEQPRFAHVEKVAHDRARQDPDRAGARALEQAEAEQRADRRARARCRGRTG